jgi:hypothetical protein
MEVEHYLVVSEQGESDRLFADLGAPDQLRGNSLIPVIENTTLGRRLMRATISPKRGVG